MHFNLGLTILIGSVYGVKSRSKFNQTAIQGQGELIIRVQSSPSEFGYALLTLLTLFCV